MMWTVHRGAIHIWQQYIFPVWELGSWPTGPDALPTPGRGFIIEYGEYLWLLYVQSMVAILVCMGVVYAASIICGFVDTVIQTLW